MRKLQRTGIPGGNQEEHTKIKEHGIEVSVLTLCFKLCPEFDSLSLFAQSMGCPKRLIKTEPDQLSLKGLLHLKMLMHTHTHAYFVIL